MYKWTVYFLKSRMFLNKKYLWNKLFTSVSYELFFAFLDDYQEGDASYRSRHRIVLIGDDTLWARSNECQSETVKKLFDHAMGCYRRGSNPKELIETTTFLRQSSRNRYQVSCSISLSLLFSFDRKLRFYKSQRLLFSLNFFVKLSIFHARKNLAKNMTGFISHINQIISID